MPVWPAAHASHASAAHSTTTSAASPTSPINDRDVDTLAAQLTQDQLKALVADRISPPIIYYVVDRIFDAVDHGLGRPSSSTAAQGRRNHVRSAGALQERRGFADFVANVFRRAEVNMSAVFGTLVYIDRALPYLSIAVAQWAHHRVLLGALIAASKYLNDASLKNAHWAQCTSVFGRNDIARIEREFLDVLDFELAVRDEHLRRTCARMILCGAIRMPIPATAQPKIQIVDETMAPLPIAELPRLEPVVKSAPSLDRIREMKREKEERSRLRVVTGSGEYANAAAAARPRPEKRHSDVDMDMDLEDYTERRQRRRQEKEIEKERERVSQAHRRAEVYLPSVPRPARTVPVARSAVATTTASSPASSDGSSCSSCPSSSALSAAGSLFPSPVSPGSSPDGNSPYTPPSYNHAQTQPHPAQAQYKPLHLLDRFPTVPVPPMPIPTPVSAMHPSHSHSSSIYARGQAPAALPSLPPLPALPFNFDEASGPASAMPISRPPSAVAYSLYPSAYRAAAMAA